MSRDGGLLGQALQVSSARSYRNLMEAYRCLYLRHNITVPKSSLVREVRLPETNFSPKTGGKWLDGHPFSRTSGLLSHHLDYPGLRQSLEELSLPVSILLFSSSRCLVVPLSFSLCVSVSLCLRVFLSLVRSFLVYFTSFFSLALPALTFSLSNRPPRHPGTPEHHRASRTGCRPQTPRAAPTL